MRIRRVLARFGLCTILGFYLPASAQAASCDAFCACGNDESYAFSSESPREEWAYLEYTVGSDLAVIRAKAHHASSPVFAETIAREMVDGRGHPAPSPGTYRSFELRAPQDRPGFGEPRRVSRALKVLKEPLAEAGVETGQLAVRVELSAGGRLVRRQEIFSTHPGLSEHLAAPLDRFLAESGLDQAGRPLVLFLIFHLDQGKVVSASTTNYIAG